MEAKVRKSLMKTMSPRERAWMRELEEVSKYFRGEKAKGLVVEIRPRPVTKGRLRGMRISVLKMDRREAARTFRVSPKTWNDWEFGRDPVSGPARLWIEALQHFPEETMSLLRRLQVPTKLKG